MPYAEHQSCETPGPGTLKIWRYMDFTKFVAMLENQSLFFPNLTSLADPFEGYLSTVMRNQFRTIPSGKFQLDSILRGRSRLCVSSWHMSEHESAAMWDLYLRTGEGIAIQSTIASMVESFRYAREHVYIAMVKYIDYGAHDIDWKPSVFAPAIYKRKNFEHERELRAIIVGSSGSAGQYVPVALEDLISCIYVAPRCDDWFVELLQKVIVRYGLRLDVTKSTLAVRPSH